MTKQRNRGSPISVGALNVSGPEHEFFQGCSNDIQTSTVVKEWLADQDALRPFGIAWPNHRKLERELNEIGFAEITVARVEPHCVYVFRGRTGKAACRSLEDLQRAIKTLARRIGFPFRAADAALNISGGRFTAALHLPDDFDLKL